MFNLPTSRQKEIAIDALLGNDALQSRDAGIYLIEGTSGRTLQDEASGATARAVGDQSGFVYHRANSALREMKRR